jgi:uncharacterized repeat protein (TIGR01451 family)
MYSQRLFSLLLAALMVLNIPAMGETTTQYYRDDAYTDSVSLDLASGEEDALTSLLFPRAEVLEAALTISGGPDNDGEYASDIEVTVRSTTWKYSGKGYGELGRQQLFASGGSSASASFPSAGDATIELLLPANATVTDATVDVSGLSYGSGVLDEFRLASENTNGGSISYSPHVVSDGDDLFVTWRDTGNLSDDNYENILFRSYTGGSWNDAIVLNGSGVGSTPILTSPKLARDGSTLYAAWVSNSLLTSRSQEIHMRVSTTSGSSWSDIKSVNLGENESPSSLDLAATDGYVYVAFADISNNSGSGSDSDVFIVSSNDAGDSWNTPVLVSSVSDSPSINPAMAVSGSNVHIVWLEYDGDNLYYTLQYRSSSNRGATFGTQQQLSSVDRNVVATSIAADSSNRIVVAWNEYDAVTGTDPAFKARASSNGGTNFGTETTLSTSEDYNVAFATVAADGNGGFFASWRRTTGDGYKPYHIVISDSSNGGSTWSTPEEVDNDVVVDFRASPWVTADGDDVAVVWSDRDSTTSASNDQDIFFTASGNGGDSWSTVADISEHYYEADSWMPALATSGDWLYLTYWDGGDLHQSTDSNGNDAHGTDGDIFFRRSSDNGESWSDPLVLSLFDADGRTSAYTLEQTDYRPTIAASGSYVYVAWVDYGLYDDDGVFDYDILMSISEDSGLTWDAPFIISEHGSDDWSFAPFLLADGSHIYIAWVEDGNVDGSGTDYDIAFRHSNDNGQSWDDIIVPSDNSYLDDAPWLALVGGALHLVWNYQYDSSILYISSDDHGASWSTITTIDSESESSSSYSPSISGEGQDLYVAWRDYGDYDGDGYADYDVILKHSGDGGETWDEPFVASDDSTAYYLYTYPALVTGNGFTYVAWQDLVDGTTDEWQHYFRFTQDNGMTWSDILPISEDNGGSQPGYTYMAPAVASGNRAYFAWADYRDIAGAGNEDSDILLRATLGDEYPDDPSIDVDGDGSSDWQWGGELNKNNSPVTWSDSGSPGAQRSLTDALNAALVDADTEVDEYGVEMARIVLQLHSDGEGVVRLNSLSVEYDVDLVFGSATLLSRLNSLVNHPDEEDETVETSISVTTGTQGRVILSGLNIRTVDAELEISEVQLSDNPPRQGHDLTLTATIVNNGDGDVENVRVAFWHDTVTKANEFGNYSLTVEVGESEQISATWQDPPAGSHELIVSIVDSTPADGDLDGNTWRNTYEFQATAPAFDAETFRLDGTAIDGENTDLLVELYNYGDRYGIVDIYVYENDEDGAAVLSELGVQIEDGETKSRSGIWVADKDVSELLLLVVDHDDDSIEYVRQSMTPTVQTLVDFSVTSVEWQDADENMLTIFTDGTEAYALITVQNSGSFDARADIEISLTRGNNRLEDVAPNYFPNVLFPAGQSQLLTQDGNLPLFEFKASKYSGFTGQWTLEVNVKEVRPEHSSDDGLWDPEEMHFVDTSHTLVVAEPPDISIDSFTASPSVPSDGDTVTFTVTVLNSGASPAAGTVRITRSGTTLGSAPFSVNGDFADTDVTIEWTVGQNINGEVSFEAELVSITPAEMEGASTEDNSASITLDIKGKMTQPGGSGSGGGGLGNLTPFLLVFAVLLVGLGGIFFYFQRTQGDQPADEEDALGEPAPAAPPVASAPPPPPAAPAAPQPAPEAPPAAAPAAPPAAAAVTIQCPGCQMQLKITDTRRPLTIACPGCQTHLKLES